MLTRGIALTAVALSFCVLDAPAGRAQGFGPDRDRVMFPDRGVERPVVWENGGWGYHDAYGRWMPAPEDYRRRMEMRYPHGAGFRREDAIRNHDIERARMDHRPGFGERPPMGGHLLPGVVAGHTTPVGGIPHGAPAAGGHMTGGTAANVHTVSTGGHAAGTGGTPPKKH